jgi:hypothetical protein
VKVGLASGPEKQGPLRRLPVVGTLPDRALWRATTYTSRLGERYGVDWLTYNPLQLLAYHRLAIRDAARVIRALRKTFPEARRLADAGAGSGAYAAEGRRQGLEVAACEHARGGRAIARMQGVRARPLDLNREPPAQLHGPFDLAYSIEVAEHLPPELGERLVRFLLELAPAVVFTAAQPGQGGLGHINQQPPEYWIERFEHAGGRHDPARSMRLVDAFAGEGVVGRWLIENAMVFERE